MVKHPAQFLNAVCANNAKGTKEYTVAVTATGGKGPEDLTAANVVGTNSGGDYSSPGLNKTGKPSDKQVFVQARIGWTTRALASHFLFTARVLVMIDDIYFRSLLTLM